MKKVILIICSLLLLISGCDKEKSAIFFSSSTITPENFSIENCQNTFQVGQRINFLLYNPKPLTNNIIKLQVVKLESNGFASGYSIAYARDIEIDTRMNYATDCFYLHKEGNYVLRIFSRNDFLTPVAEQIFTVK
ncbi:MAG: hypothetical protein PHC34_00210 [Candidatus Gastranaerophilales bacterium]|nr:hypothetical protein [Candidatus Gastranaerophilales bacterium]